MTRSLTAPPDRADAMSSPVDQASRLRALVEAGAPRSRPAEPRRPVTPAPAGPARVLAVASGKGGVGKTTLAVNLSVALAAHDLRTTLLDADMGTANADLLCGVSPRRRLDAWLEGIASGADSSIDGLAIEAPGGFRLVPGIVGLSRGRTLDEAQRRAVSRGVDELERRSDIVVVDAAAGVGRDVLSILDLADVSIIVSTPEPTSIADAYALIKCSVSFRNGMRGARARRHGIGPRDARLALVVNQARDVREAVEVHRRISAVAQRFLGARVAMLGAVASDPAVGAAVRAKHPLLCARGAPPAARDLRAIGSLLAQLLRPGARRERRLSEIVGARRHEWSSDVRRRNR